MTSRNVNQDSPVDWVRKVNMENRVKDLDAKRNANIAQVEDDWDDETGVFGEIPAEPTRKQSFAEINAQLAATFGTNETRTLEIDPEIWFDIDVTVDPDDTIVG
jgi:hypothetical protein